MRFQVVNIAEAYAYGRDAVVLVLRDKQKRRRELLVTGVRVTFMVNAVSLNEGMYLKKIGGMLKNPNRFECKRTYCPNCSPREFPAFQSKINKRSEETYLNHYVCPEDRLGGKVTGVINKEIHMKKPFHVYSGEAMPYLEVQVAQVEDLDILVSATHKFQKEQGIPKEEWGCFNVENSIVDYFMQQTGIACMNWIEVEEEEDEIDASKLGEPFVDENVFRYAFWDLETISPLPNGRSFPKQHPIGMISLITDEGKMLLHWHERDIHVDGVVVKKFKTEKEMIEAFFQLTADVDFMVAYNGANFDWPYITERAEINRVFLDNFWGMKYCFRGRQTRSTVENNQIGKMDVGITDYAGKIMMDPCMMARKKLKMDGYGLKDLAAYCGQESKEVFEYDDIFIVWSGDYERLDELAKYCVKDSEVVKSCVEYLDWLNQTAAHCVVCYATPQSVLDRGVGYLVRQTVRAMCSDTHCFPVKLKNSFLGIQMKEGLFQGGNLTLAEIREQEEGWPDRCAQNPRMTMFDPTEYKGGYGGGKVLDPDPPGLYTRPTMVLDFSGLYPSLIISCNMDPSTLIRKEEYREERPLREDAETFTAPNGLVFTKKQIGVIPRLCKYLLEKRKESRKIAEEAEPGSARAKSFDALQLAYKLIANSSYGVLGFCANPLSCVPVAEAITMQGQRSLLYCKDFFDKLEDIKREGIGAIFLPPRPTAPIPEIDRLIQARLRVFYGDTDSLFVEIGNPDLDYAAARELCGVVSKVIAKHMGFLKPMKFEFEALYQPMVIMQKKHYIAWDPSTQKMKIRGVAITKRSYFPFLQILMQAVVDKVFKEGQTDRVEIGAFVAGEMRRLIRGEVDRKELLLSKKLNKEPEDYAQANAQTQLAEILLRNGKRAEVGDRLSYFFIPSNQRNAAQRDRVFPASMMDEFGLEPDYEAYFTACVEPMESLLQYMVGSQMCRVIMMKHTYRSNCDTYGNTELKERLRVFAEDVAVKKPKKKQRKTASTTESNQKISDFFRI